NLNVETISIPMRLFTQTVASGIVFIMAAFGLILNSAMAQIPGNEAAGRWDITLESPNGPQPSWLEISESGNQALVGRFVGVTGSARPVSEIMYSEEEEPTVLLFLHNGRHEMISILSLAMKTGS